MIQSFYQKIKQGLKKTRDQLNHRLNEVLSNFRTVDEELLEELEAILIQGDLGVETSTRFIEKLRKKAKLENISDPGIIIEFLKSELDMELEGNETSAEFMARINRHKPFVIVIVGVNGTGKTTTIGKLANHFIREGKRVMIGAADTFRAAAVEQLEIWAQRSGAGFVSHTHQNADPAAVAFDAYQSAVAKNFDVVLIDTAGRLHTKIHLMDELKKIDRVLKKANAEIPHEYWLIIDGNSGQNALVQTQVFAKSVPLNGIVVTKLDGTAHGGVLVAIHHQFHLPIKFIGVGEGLDDLQPFNRNHFINALFDNQ